MMILSNRNHTQTTQSLRPIFGFLRSLMTLRGVSGGRLSLLGIREQGRKPSGIIWADSLFGMTYGSDVPADNNEQPVKDDDARKRCRSHGERFHT